MQLREIRTRRRLTQEQLAKLVGMPPAHIGHFEIASRKPNYQNLIRLADALQVSVDELMGRTLTCTYGGSLGSVLGELTTDDLDLVDRFAKMLLARKSH